MSNEKKIKFYCFQGCEGQAVRDTTAFWNPDKQDWELGDPIASTPIECENCGDEMNELEISTNPSVVELFNLARNILVSMEEHYGQHFVVELIDTYLENLEAAE